MTTKLKKFVLPDSGIEVTMKGISPAMIGLDVMRSIPKPQPPIQIIDNGDGDVVYEKNWSHPDYKIELAQWDVDVNLKTMPVIVYRSLVKILSDEEKAEIKELRQDMADMDVTLDRNDKIVWFKYIACGSDADFYAYVEFLSGEGEPKPEVVESLQDGFPGDVQGEGHMEMPDTSERS